jgi:hypothetical protein
LKAMLLAKLRMGAALLIVALVGGGSALISAPRQTTPAPPEPRPQQAAPASKQQTKGDVDQGRVQGRFTAADTGKPVGGVKIQVEVPGLPREESRIEAVSDAQGKYSLPVPLGHCRILGIYAPPGYYTQDVVTHVITTTKAAPVVERDFKLQSGSSWKVELRGVKILPGKSPHLTAEPDPDSHFGGIYHSGELISVIGDRQGRATLTIPVAGGNYRFRWLTGIASGYEIAPANLEIDKAFDPGHVKQGPDRFNDSNDVRLIDSAGRIAVIEGAEVHIDKGQAVLVFQAQLPPAAQALVFRGSAVDETGKPVQEATFTAALLSANHAGMSDRKATTDAKGKMELRDVLLPRTSYETDGFIRMIVTKPGYHAVQTTWLTLSDVERTGKGDFGVVVLKPGHALSGKVVDENGRPLQGAVVTNMTDYFLYSTLQCRTDGNGRFVMPDLAYGQHRLSAQFGERRVRDEKGIPVEKEVEFDSNNTECILIVRPFP